MFFQTTSGIQVGSRIEFVLPEEGAVRFGTMLRHMGDYIVQVLDDGGHTVLMGVSCIRSIAAQGGQA